MGNYTNNLYMKQIIKESGIKSNACNRDDCTSCNNLIKCYIDASKKEDSNIDLNYGGYETEIHY